MTELAWIRGACPWCDAQLEAVEVSRAIPFGQPWVALELLEESLAHLADAHSVGAVGST